MTLLQLLPPQMNRAVWLSVSIFMAVLADTFFWNKILDWNLPIFVGLLIGLRFGVEWAYTNRLTYTNLLIGLIAFVVSLSTISQSGYLLRFFNLLVIWYLILIIWKPNTGKTKIDFVTWLGIEQLVSIGNAFTTGIRKLRTTLPKPSFIQSQTMQSITTGVLISIPLLLFFGVLLASSDSNFASSINEVSKSLFNLFTIESFIRLCVVVVYVLVFFGFGFLVKPLQIFKEKSIKLEKRKGQDLESLIPLGGLATLFAVYLGFQLSYLVGGRDYVARIESTFAEFAKRGFFKLLFVGICIFTLVLIWDKIRYGTKYLRNRNFAIITVIVVAESAVMLVSAWSKLSLYIDGYGYTNLRLFTQVWIMCMGFSLLLLIWKLTSKLKTYNLLYLVSWVFIVGLLILNIIQPDKYIAKYNLTQSNWNKSDISSYHYDGLIAIKPLISNAEYRGTLDFRTLCTLKDKQDYLLNVYPTKSWYEQNPLLNNAKYEFADINLIDNGRVNECYRIRGGY